MQARQLLREIVEREHPITVRGCFYRAVSAGLYPGTEQKYYLKCAKLMQELRQTYIRPIPYEWIVDSSREREASTGFDGPTTYLEDMANSYSRNYWLDQPKHIEVITEKDAMATILASTIQKWNVPFTVFRGNPSDTMCYHLGQLAKTWEQPVVLYLGDHDPSGLHISKVARQKIQRFSGRQLEWVRVAVTGKQFDQMKSQFGIPTKKGDNLRTAYQAQYGNLCVEVDAIPSNEIRDKLDQAIQKRVDLTIWEQTRQKEENEQRQIKRLVSKIRL